MKKHRLLILLAILLFTQCQFYQDLPKADYDNSSGTTERYRDNNYQRSSGNYPPNAHPGSCYAKSMIGPQYAEEDTELDIYTGDETEENVETQIVELEVKPATTKWVRRKREGKCLSADPNDCLVWCLVEVPAVVEQHEVVTNPATTTNVETIRVRSEKLISEGGFTAWVEVLCPGDVTQHIVQQVQNALRADGYYEGTNSSTMDKEVKDALVKFQKDNGLPIGSLDFETLDMLGISY